MSAQAGHAVGCFWSWSSLKLRKELFQSCDVESCSTYMGWWPTYSQIITTWWSKRKTGTCFNMFKSLRKNVPLFSLDCFARTSQRQYCNNFWILIFGEACQACCTTEWATPFKFIWWFYSDVRVMFWHRANVFSTRWQKNTQNRRNTDLLCESWLALQFHRLHPLEEPAFHRAWVKEVQCLKTHSVCTKAELESKNYNYIQLLSILYLYIQRVWFCLLSTGINVQTVIYKSSWTSFSKHVNALKRSGYIRSTLLHVFSPMFSWHACVTS